MDDQAETLMLHLVRGSGLVGLAGMRGRAQWPFGRGPDIARPLLCLSRKEIEAYCREAGAEPRRDPTNDVPVPTRNRIRLRVIPELRAINPRAVEALARLADSVAADAEYLDSAAQLAAEGLTFERRSVRLPRGYLNSLPGAMAGRLVRMAVAHVCGSHAGVEATHIEAVLALAKGRPGRLSLPNGVNVGADSHTLTIGRGIPDRAKRIPETPIAVPGVTLVPGWRIESAVVSVPADLRSSNRLEAFIGLNAASGGMAVRSRRPGDRLRPLGLKGEKKVQDVLVDAKVPAGERDGVPIVCDDDGILWVVGHCLDERAAVGPGAGQALHIRMERLRNEG
jgi:tRNA(Ile)-lysidine synthase